jgi:hypothetical protein
VTRSRFLGAWKATFTPAATASAGGPPTVTTSCRYVQNGRHRGMWLFAQITRSTARPARSAVASGWPCTRLAMLLGSEIRSTARPCAARLLRAAAPCRLPITTIHHRVHGGHVCSCSTASTRSSYGWFFDTLFGGGAEREAAEKNRALAAQYKTDALGARQDLRQGTTRSTRASRPTTRSRRSAPSTASG